MTQLSRTALQTAINTNIADNTSHSISPAKVRQMLTNLNDSGPNTLTDVATGIFSNSSTSVLPAAGISNTANFSYRKKHHAVVAATNIQVGFSGYNNGSGSPTAYTWNVQCAFQRADSVTGLPTGVPTVFTFSGVAAGVVPSGGQLMSDIMAVSIAAGEIYYTICYAVNSTAGYNCWVSNELGEGFASGNQTTTGTFAVDNSQTYVIAIAPSIIIGTLAVADKIGVISFTDSIGVNTNGSRIGYKLGWQGLAMATSRPILNCGIGGSSVQNFITAGFYGAILTPYAAYVRDCIFNYGFNDLFANSRSLANIEADITTAVGLIKTAGIRRVVGCTVKAKTTSTDGFLTLVNQSPVVPSAGANSLNFLNKWIMANNGLLFEIVFDFAGTLSTTDAQPLLKTGPANIQLTDVAGASTSVNAIRTSGAAVGDISMVGSLVKITHSAVDYYGIISGFRPGSPNLFFLGTALAQAAAGDTYVIYDAWGGDGSHPTGKGYEEASHYFPVSALR